MRKRDYYKANHLFEPDVIAFGTVTKRAVNLRDLYDQQWRTIWPHTTGFEFEFNTVVFFGNDRCIVASSIWKSYRRILFWKIKRTGRVTIVLARRPVKLKAVHTHFSISP